MSLFAYLNGSDVGNKIRLGAAGLETHADGTPGFGNIVFDDEAATLTVRGFMSVKVVETACTSAPVLFYGYIGPRNYTRTSGNVTYKVGAARFIDTTIVDLYARLSHRLITGEDGNRDAEDHNTRIDWLLASDYLSGLVADFGLIDRSHPRPFEKSDYRGQKPDDVLTDLAGPIFKGFFAVWDLTEDAAGLFFDELTTATNTSTLTISNVLSDITIAGGVITGTCYPPSVDASLNRDPSEVYSLGRETYRGGTVIERDTTTLATFFTDNGLGHRGTQISNDRVGLESTARIQLDGILERASEEHDTIQVTIQLPPEQVGLIDAGMRVGVRFAHLPGYETQVFMRVTTRHVTQTEGSTSLYDVTLVLDNQGRSSVGHGDPGDFPLPPTPTATHYYSGTFSDSVGTGGGADDATIFTSAMFHADTTWNYSVTVDSVTAGHELLVGFRVYADDTPTLFPFLVVDPAIATMTGSFTTGADDEGPAHAWLNILHNDIAPGTAQVTFWIDPEGWDTAETPTAPSPGQEVPWAVVTMSGAEGTTLWPYAAGSLKVKVDGVLISPASYTETDPACGDFTLSWSPDTDEVVTVTYQGI